MVRQVTIGSTTLKLDSRASDSKTHAHVLNALLPPKDPISSIISPMVCTGGLLTQGDQVEIPLNREVWEAVRVSTALQLLLVDDGEWSTIGCNLTVCH
jgi:hypothetical protein